MSINNNECYDDLNDGNVIVDAKETSEYRVVEKTVVEKRKYRDRSKISTRCNDVSLFRQV